MSCKSTQEFWDETDFQLTRRNQFVPYVAECRTAAKPKRKRQMPPLPKFVEVAFEVGDIQGMTANDIQQYIRYICDWRLTQLKLRPIYGYFVEDSHGYSQNKAHPLPWLTSILNGVEHANFFETRATEYSKAATKGEWHGETSVWKLFDQSKRRA